MYPLFLPVIPVAIWEIIGAVLVAAGGAGIYKLAKKPGKKTKSIAILGMPGAGKTELWCQLGKKAGKDFTHLEPGKATQGQSRVDQFDLKRSDNSEIDIKKFKKPNKIERIKRTFDLGGGDRYVKMYEEVIGPDTFVYFLIDITKMENKKHMDGVKARLEKILDIFNKNESTGQGINFLLTHVDKFSNSKSPEDYAINKIPDKYTDWAKGTIMAVNLREDKDIQKIVNDIVRV